MRVNEHVYVLVYGQERYNAQIVNLMSKLPGLGKGVTVPTRSLWQQIFPGHSLLMAMVDSTITSRKNQTKFNGKDK
jgi:hypothetical protein